MHTSLIYKFVCGTNLAQVHLKIYCWTPALYVLVQCYPSHPPNTYRPADRTMGGHPYDCFILYCTQVGTEASGSAVFYL